CVFCLYLPDHDPAHLSARDEPRIGDAGRTIRKEICAVCERRSASLPPIIGIPNAARNKIRLDVISALPRVSRGPWPRDCLGATGAESNLFQMSPSRFIRFKLVLRVIVALVV